MWELNAQMVQNVKADEVSNLSRVIDPIVTSKGVEEFRLVQKSELKPIKVCLACIMILIEDGSRGVIVCAKRIAASRIDLVIDG